MPETPYRRMHAKMIYVQVLNIQADFAFWDEENFLYL